MKKILKMLVVAAIVVTGCSKLETKDLINTYWTGSMTSTAFQEDEKADLSFEFKTGKADFTYLPYGEQHPETGVLLYSLADNVLTLSNANGMLNGDWSIIHKKGEHMTLEKTEGGETRTIEIQKRR